MSALRVRTPDGVALVDPTTRQPYRPVLATWNEAAPVVIVQPALRPANPPRPDLRREPRKKGLYLAHLTDDDIRAALKGRSQEGAAAVLGTSQASIARRLRQMRAAR